MNINRIRTDIATARMCCSPVANPTNDEYFYDVAAYHTQQAIEKCLKYYLHDVYGMDDNSREYYTHNVALLLVLLNRYDPTFIKEHDHVVKISDLVTKWEASCRYGEDLIAAREDILNALTVADILYTEILELEAERHPDLEAEIEEER